MAGTKFLQTNSSFALGEVSPGLKGRGDLKTAAFGLSRLENMDIMSSGGICRRAGTRAMTGNMSRGARMFSFKKKGGEEYLVVLGDRNLKVFRGKTQYASLDAPWSEEDLPKVQAAQLKDILIFTHPKIRPYRLSSDPWYLVWVQLDYDNDRQYMPWHKFENSNWPFSVANFPNNGSRMAILTSLHNQWGESCVGTNMKFGGIEWWIVEYIAPTQVRVATNDTATPMPTGTVSDWSEGAFGNWRGWPAGVTVYQNRLVFAGTESLPNFIWMSQTGRHFNFDTGSGLDSEAVVASLLSDRQHNIVSVQSGENLEVLTDAGEWSVKGSPITPANLMIRQHTNIGSNPERFAAPQRVDGATLFVSKNSELRELRLDNLSDSYSATDLSALSSHLMTGPKCAAYHQASKRLFVVQSDGTMAVLKKDDNLEILGWSVYKTDGPWHSVAVADDTVYAVASHGAEVSLERFDETKMTDGPFNAAYSHKAAAMPVFSDGTPARLARLVKWKARVMDAESLQVRLNGGELETVPLPEIPFTGDVVMNSLGTAGNADSPLWEISGSEPKPLAILSITVEGRISI
ncbi:MAG: hypothetical protein LBH81_00105 [Rickettsiales bacterium]|jgi:hypothetical protein|nr:hypothetical protein [Rickettsiales bacterium]